MKLSFHAPHLSIVGFPETELPDFALITGVNGSGKTHLLKAITDGRIQVDVAPQPRQDAKYFDWTNMTPNDAGEFHVTQLYSERDQVLRSIDQLRTQHRPQLIEVLGRNEKLRDWCKDPWSLLTLSEEQIAEITGDISASQQLYLMIKGVSDVTNLSARRVGANPAALRTIGELAGTLQKPWLSITQGDLDQYPFEWGEVDMFQQSFARMFLAYLETVKLNRLHQLDFNEGRQLKPGLTESAFISEHGEPPWNFINKVLEEAGIDFEIDHPVGYMTVSYQPKLTKKSSGAPISFADLSSGEKVLMSFAFCLYHSVDARQTVRKPKLLLLDEIDAPLHPSMSRMVVNAINKTLVGDQDVKVIMATHSPSTVAVAPEDAIYVMHPGEDGVHKVGKRQAIAVLTRDIPTLSISFDGRRQVFVESESDAERYDLLYRHLSPQIRSERSLVFIGVAKRKSGEPDRNAGCSAVKSVVKALSDAGNESVYGLIDWDRTNESEGRVCVLGPDERYAIENCLLDPLLVAALALRENLQFGDQLGLPSGTLYAEMLEMPVEQLQAIVNAVQRKVLGLAHEAPLSNHIRIEYAGGLQLLASSDYLHMNGHDLESAVRDKIPHLRRFHNEGELLKAIVEPIIAENPLFVPRVLVEAFSTILDSEAA
jgi:predicted ATPase